MAISGLLYVVNLSDLALNFTNSESSGNNRRIDRDRLGDVGNAWTPWCDNAPYILDKVGVSYAIVVLDAKTVKAVVVS